MNMQAPVTPQIRAATPRDIPFLARMDVEASTPPFDRPLWDELLEGTGTPTQRFVETMFREQASNWGGVSDFLVLEVSGEPAAACAVFRPRNAPDNPGPLNLNRLEQIAWSLSWSAETMDRVRAAYAAVWAGDTAFMTPQAELIIETVAVAPGRRGSGLGRALMRAAFDRGRQLGAQSIGISVIHGNNRAQALYEKHFEPFVTYHAAYFDHQFPGLTKYRASLV